MGIVISGKKLATSIKEGLNIEVNELKEKYGRAPHLVVILVGNNPSSMSYVAGKERASLEVGIQTETIHLEDTISTNELLKVIDNLNKDELVDGILVQLPLPKHINEKLIINSIDYKKDVDGFHPTNVYNLQVKNKTTYPCTPYGIIKILESKNIEIAGKRAVVIGRSNIVGLPVAKMLLDKNATVTICHSKTVDLASVTREADILVVAIGVPKFVTSDMVKDGAVVIDVGISKQSDGTLAGDVDFENVKDKTSYITKVPGGVGPMTIAMLMENTVTLFKEKMEK